jgi:hypothetical protein
MQASTMFSLVHNNPSPFSMAQEQGYLPNHSRQFSTSTALRGQRSHQDWPEGIPSDENDGINVQSDVHAEAALKQDKSWCLDASCNTQAHARYGHGPASSTPDLCRHSPCHKKSSDHNSFTQQCHPTSEMASGCTTHATRSTISRNGPRAVHVHLHCDPEHARWKVSKVESESQQLLCLLREALSTSGSSKRSPQQSQTQPQSFSREHYSSNTQSMQQLRAAITLSNDANRVSTGDNGIGSMNIMENLNLIKSAKDRVLEKPHEAADEAGISWCEPSPRVATTSTASDKHLSPEHHFKKQACRSGHQADPVTVLSSATADNLREPRKNVSAGALHAGRASCGSSALHSSSTRKPQSDEDHLCASLQQSMDTSEHFSWTPTRKPPGQQNPPRLSFVGVNAAARSRSSSLPPAPDQHTEGGANPVYYDASKDRLPSACMAHLDQAESFSGIQPVPVSHHIRKSTSKCSATLENDRSSGQENEQQHSFPPNIQAGPPNADKPWSMAAQLGLESKRSLVAQQAHRLSIPPSASSKSSPYVRPSGTCQPCPLSRNPRSTSGSTSPSSTQPQDRSRSPSLRIPCNHPSISTCSNLSPLPASAPYSKGDPMSAKKAPFRCFAQSFNQQSLAAGLSRDTSGGKGTCGEPSQLRTSWSPSSDLAQHSLGAPDPCGHPPSKRALGKELQNVRSNHSLYTCGTPFSEVYQTPQSASSRLPRLGGSASPAVHTIKQHSRQPKAHTSRSVSHCKPLCTKGSRGPPVSTHCQLSPTHCCHSPLHTVNASHCVLTSTEPYRKASNPPRLQLSPPRCCQSPLHTVSAIWQSTRCKQTHTSPSDCCRSPLRTVLMTNAASCDHTQWSPFSRASSSYSPRPTVSAKSHPDATARNSRSLSASAAAHHRPSNSLSTAPIANSSTPSKKRLHDIFLPQPTSPSCSSHCDPTGHRKSYQATFLNTPAADANRLYSCQKRNEPLPVAIPFNRNNECRSNSRAHTHSENACNSDSRVRVHSETTSDSNDSDLLLENLPACPKNLSIGALEKALQAVEASLACSRPRRGKAAVKHTHGGARLCGMQCMERGRSPCTFHKCPGEHFARNKCCCQRNLSRSHSADRAKGGCSACNPCKQIKDKGISCSRTGRSRAPKKFSALDGHAIHCCGGLRHPLCTNKLRAQTNNKGGISVHDLHRMKAVRRDHYRHRQSSFSRSRSPGRIWKASNVGGCSVTEARPAEMSSTSAAKSRGIETDVCLSCAKCCATSTCPCSHGCICEAPCSAGLVTLDVCQSRSPQKPQGMQESRTPISDNKMIGAARAAEARVQRKAHALEAEVTCHKVSGSVPIEHTRTSLLRIRAARHSQLHERVRETSLIDGVLAR